MAKNTIEKFMKNKSKMSKLRRTITCLAAVVVFATTYALILPAMTLDGSDAQKTPGIDTKTEINVEKFGQSLGGDQDSGSDVADNAAQAVNSEEKDVSGGEGALQSEGNGEETPEAAMNSEGEKANGSDSKVGSDNKANDVKDGAKKDTAGSKDSKTADDNKDKKGGSKDLSLITEKTEIKFDGKGYKVIAEVGADAKLPADTKLKVREIKDGDKNENGKEYAYDAYCDEALKAVRDKDGEDGEDLKRQVKLYDIKFVSESSNKDKVEPAAPVKVTIKYDEVIARSDKNVIRAVHFDDTDLDKDKAAEAMIDKDKLHDVKKVVLETKSEKNDADSMKDVQFKSDRFSVYGIVYTVNAEEQKKEQKEEQKAEDSNIRTLTANGKTYDVTVSFGKDANIPENAELRVKEIKEDDKEYKAVQEKAGDELSKKIKKQIPQHPVLFDIAIYDGDEEIEPAKGSSVKVEVKMAKGKVNGMFTDDDSPLLINNEPVDAEEQKMNQKLKVIHDVKDGELEVVDVEENNTKKKIVGEFETESFSNWLLYLDDEFENNEITVHVGDSLTLRPYGQWYWKKDGEPADLQALNWLFPSNDYNTTTGSQTVPTNYSGGTATYQGITQAKTKDGKYTFSGNAKYDRELQEPYWFYNAENLNQPGEFKLYIGTQSGVTKTITVKVIEGESSQKPGTVEGLSNIKVNLFDYDNGGVLDEGRDWQGNINKNLASNVFNNTINVGHPLKFLSSGSGNQNNGAGLNDYTNQSPHQGLVNNKLGSDKFPHLSSSFDSNQSSLGYLFDTSKTWGNSDNSIQAYPNVTGLFQKDSKGYYYYNSNKNYAYYDQTSNSMILYEHTYTQDTAGTNGANAKPIGFFPFHEYDSMNDLHVNQNKNLNHHLGMSMEVGFTLPSNKLTDDGEHIRYEFSGDDDLWVYVDDDLVLDIGGIHQPVRGYIDFTEGKVYVYNVNGGQPKEIAAVKNLTTGEEHKLRMFYLERGGCDSNLSVRFNLPLIPTASLNVMKYDKSANPVAPLQGVEFAVYSDQECTKKIGEYTSKSNGMIEIKDLQIKNEETRYYLKETKALSGYKQDDTLYKLVPVLAKENPKEYRFKIVKASDETETEIGTIGQNPAYPVLYNEQAKPIDLTVEKQWKNEDGDPVAIPGNASAKFKVQRYFKYKQEDTSQPCTFKVYRSKGNTTVQEGETYSFKGGTSVEVNWGYDAGYIDFDTSRKNKYKENLDSSSFKIKPDNGPAVIDLPESGTACIYINDEDIGSVYDPGVVNITVNGTPYQPTGPISTDWAKDDVYNNASNVPTITLPETSTDPDSWKGKFSSLPILKDKDNKTYQYKYYIVETDKTPSDSQVVYLDNGGQPVGDPATLATDSNGTQTIINKVPNGKLKIKKEVQYNNAAPPEDKKELFEGDYTFTVYKDELCTQPYPNADDPITFTVHIGENAQPGFSEEKELPAGDYWVKENVSDDAQIVPVGSNPQKVTVDPGESTAQAKIHTVTNNLIVNEGDDNLTLDVEKEFSGIDGASDIPEDFQIVVTYELNGKSKSIILKCEASHTTTDGLRVNISQSSDGLSWKWHIYGINKNSTNVQVKEINYTKDGYEHSATYNDTKIEAPNSPSDPQIVPLTAGAATLTEVEGRTTSQTNMEHYILDDDYVVLVAITGKVHGTAVVSKRSLNMAERDAITKGIESIQQGPFTNDHMWFYSEEEHFIEGQDVTVSPVHNRDLTFKTVDGQHIIVCPPSSNKQAVAFSISYGGEPSITNATYTNNYTDTPIEIDIIKEDKSDSNKKLSGAVFTLRQIRDEAPNNGTIATLDGTTPRDSGETNANGKTSFDDLTGGYYEITEKTAPAGYILKGDTAFYFKIVHGTVTWLNKGTGEPSTWTTKTSDDMVSFTAGTPATEGHAATNAAFTVKNESGPALPSSGGFGTTWMYILGMLLTLGAGMSLVVRRRMSV